MLEDLFSDFSSNAPESDDEDLDVAQGAHSPGLIYDTAKEVATKLNITPDEDDEQAQAIIIAKISEMADDTSQKIFGKGLEELDASMESPKYNAFRLRLMNTMQKDLRKLLTESGTPFQQILAGVAFLWMCVPTIYPCEHTYQVGDFIDRHTNTITSEFYDVVVAMNTRSCQALPIAPIIRTDNPDGHVKSRLPRIMHNWRMSVFMHNENIVTNLTSKKATGLTEKQSKLEPLPEGVFPYITRVIQGNTYYYYPRRKRPPPQQISRWTGRMVRRSNPATANSPGRSYESFDRLVYETTSQDSYDTILKSQDTLLTKDILYQMTRMGCTYYEIFFSENSLNATNTLDAMMTNIVSDLNGYIHRNKGPETAYLFENISENDDPEIKAYRRKTRPPYDLKSVQSNIESDIYETPAQFILDIRRMIRSVKKNFTASLLDKLHTGIGSDDLHVLCNDLSEEFDRLIALAAKTQQSKQISSQEDKLHSMNTQTTLGFYNHETAKAMAELFIDIALTRPDQDFENKKPARSDCRNVAIDIDRSTPILQITPEPWHAPDCCIVYSEARQSLMVFVTKTVPYYFRGESTIIDEKKKERWIKECKREAILTAISVVVQATKGTLIIIANQANVKSVECFLALINPNTDIEKEYEAINTESRFRPSGPDERSFYRLELGTTTIYHVSPIIQFPQKATPADDDPAAAGDTPEFETMRYYMSMLAREYAYDKITGLQFATRKETHPENDDRDTTRNLTVSTEQLSSVDEAKNHWLAVTKALIQNVRSKDGEAQNNAFMLLCTCDKEVSTDNNILDQFLGLSDDDANEDLSPREEFEGGSSSDSADEQPPKSPSDRRPQATGIGRPLTRLQKARLEAQRGRDPREAARPGAGTQRRTGPARLATKKYKTIKIPRGSSFVDM